MTFLLAGLNCVHTPLGLGVAESGTPLHAHPEIGIGKIGVKGIGE
jgi:hypothetical protein